MHQLILDSNKDVKLHQLHVILLVSEGYTDKIGGREIQKPENLFFFQKSKTNLSQFAKSVLKKCDGINSISLVHLAGG